MKSKNLDTPSIVVSDPMSRKTVVVTERELELINLIRMDKGLGPVLVHSQTKEH